MTVHQCPFCDLRFLLLNEVTHHVSTDHPDHEPHWGLLEPSEKGRPTSFRDDRTTWTPGPRGENG